MEKKSIDEMTYEEMIKVIASTDVSTAERGEELIKSACKMIEAILEHKYAVDHNFSSDIINDKMNTLKNKMATMVSDVDVFMHSCRITESVLYKAKKRIKGIVARLYRVR